MVRYLETMLELKLVNMLDKIFVKFSRFILFEKQVIYYKSFILTFVLHKEAIILKRVSAAELHYTTTNGSLGITLLKFQYPFTLLINVVIGGLLYSLRSQNYSAVLCLKSCLIALSI